MPNESFFNLKEAKRDRIMKACFNEIINSSFEKFKISNVIKECKIARGSFYYYFENKYDLYSYALELVNKNKMSFLATIIQDDSTDSYSLFAESVRCFLEYRNNDKILFKAGSKLRKTGIEELSNKQREYDIVIRNYVSEKLTSEAGHLNDGFDVNILAEFFVILFNEDTIDMLKKTEYSDENIIENMTMLIMKGIYRG